MKPHNNVPEVMSDKDVREMATAVQEAGDCPHTAESEPRETDWNELKVAINNAIWMHAPETLTLKQADEAACRAISYIGECWDKTNTKRGPLSCTHCGGNGWEP